MARDNDSHDNRWNQSSEQNSNWMPSSAPSSNYVRPNQDSQRRDHETSHAQFGDRWNTSPMNEQGRHDTDQLRAHQYGSGYQGPNQYSSRQQGSSQHDNSRSHFGQSNFGQSNQSNFGQSGPMQHTAGQKALGYSSSTNYGMSPNAGSETYSGTSGTSTTWGPHSGKGPKNYRRSDDRIREDVSDALERHPHVDASQLEVEVKDGVVTLRGHVEERRLKREIEDSIDHVPGVRDIRNELQVDQSLFQRAKSALFGESAEANSGASTNANASSTPGSKPRH